jgi:pimeloyl-ACP methyl ester carboxylesterase
LVTVAPGAFADGVGGLAAGVRRPGRPGRGLLGVPGNCAYAGRLPNASHWVHHDEHERVNELLIDFFGPARPAKG